MSRFHVHIPSDQAIGERNEWNWRSRSSIADSYSAARFTVDSMILIGSKAILPLS
ncbi:MAG: hypothetical protein AB8B55_01320 [Mariniblastus sp.]